MTSFAKYFICIMKLYSILFRQLVEDSGRWATIAGAMTVAGKRSAMANGCLAVVGGHLVVTDGQSTIS